MEVIELAAPMTQAVDAGSVVVTCAVGADARVTAKVPLTVEVGDTDQAETWELQAYVELADWSGSSTAVKHQVGERLYTTPP